jgi:twitching motility protein PilT
MANIDELLEKLIKVGGSALHLTRGRAPRVRRDGVLGALEGAGRLEERDVEDIVKALAPPEAWRSFKRREAVGFGYASDGVGRFRVHVYRHEGGIGVVLRQTPSVATLDELGLPPIIKTMTRLRGAIVLIAGPAGAGKSSTIGALLSEIDQRLACHVVTIEHPIELTFTGTQAGFTQREVGKHTPSVAEGLHEASGMSADVIVAASLCHERSVSLALAAAEAGTLVLCAVQADGVARAVERLLEPFPLGRRGAIRRRLANVFGGASSQILLPLATGRGRCAAVEVLPPGRVVRAAIREGDPDALMATMTRLDAAQTLDAALADLISRGRIRPEDAYDHARDKSHFERLLPR